MTDINNQNTIGELDSDVDFNGETASSLVSEMIKKYNLKDFSEEDIEKLDKGEPFIIPGTVIIDCAKKIALLKISDQDAKLLLEKNLKIPAEKIDGLIQDIKTKVVPVIQKFADVRKNIPKNETTDNDLIRREKPIPLISIKEKIDDDLIETNEKKLAEDSAPIKKSRLKKIPKSETLEKPPTTSQQNDSYREPIK